MASRLPARSEIEKKDRWNAESVFASAKAFDAEIASVLADAPGVERLSGSLSSGPEALAAGLAAAEELTARMNRCLVYADFAYSVDTTDSAAAAINARAQAALGRVSAAVAFVEPELLAMGREKVDGWVRGDQRLSRYAHFVENLFRRQAHVRSTEVEELLGMASEPFCGPANLAGMLLSADFTFPDALGSDGKKREVTQGSLHAILGGTDRAARKSAWQGYMDRHAQFRNTLSMNLANSIRQNAFKARARRFSSTLEAALHPDAVPVEVFHNAVAVFRKNLPTWHRYFDLKRRALKLRDFHHYDVWAPLTKKRTRIPYERAVDLICEGLAPMGPEYVREVRVGCLKDRWVDHRPNKGKREGAFSSGAPGTMPFILMSYTDNVESLSTLAHELGHSMHSLNSFRTQPLAYANYSLFAAEVASNFHQALVRDSLLKAGDRALSLEVLDEGMSNFHRYLFLMPTLARFELETHQRVERGESLTADSMADLMTELLREAYGPGVGIEREREGMLWASFTHLFVDYYVFQYETGISGAQALAGRVLRGEPGAVRDYLGFISAGSSAYALDALKAAGVDLSRPEPIEEAFAIMRSYVDRLEELLF
jgi:oligoendopeptidase F